MIKRVYKCANGETFVSFNEAKERELDLADDWIGNIMDDARVVRDLSHNPIQQKNQIHNFLTANCEQLIDALLNYKEANELQQDDFEDET